LATGYNNLKILNQENKNNHIKVLNNNKKKFVNKNVSEASSPKPVNKGEQQANTNQKANRQTPFFKRKPNKIGKNF
jgi:hypothetical protein